MQEEEGQPVGVHGGLAGPESGASALISWAFAAAPPRLPGGSFQIIYTPPTLGGAPWGNPCWGPANREETHKASQRSLKVQGPSICLVWVLTSGYYGLCL